MWRNGGIAPSFLTFALDGGEWSASRLCHFTPGTHWIGGWVGPRAGLDAVEKRRILPLPGTEPQPSCPYPVAVPTELSRFASQFDNCIISSAIRSAEGRHAHAVFLEAELCRCKARCLLWARNISYITSA
jgi:hypothetical protein